MSSLTHLKRLRPQRLTNWLSIANLLRYGLVMLVLASLLLTSGILIRISAQSQLQKSQLLQQTRSRAVAQSIESELNDLQNEMQYLERVRGLAALPQNVQRDLLEGLTRSNDAFQAIATFNLNGDILVSVSPFEQNPQHLANDLTFLDFVPSGHRYVSPVSINAHTEHPFILFAVPMRDVNDQVNGALLAEIDLDFLNFTVSQAQVGETGYTYVVDEQEQIIAKKRTESEAYEAYELESIAQTNLIQHLVSDPAAEFSIYSGLRGQSVLGATSAVYGMGWRVVSELPLTEVRAPVREMNRVMLAVLGLSVLFVGTLGTGAAHWLTSPLRRLTLAATQISQGQLNTEVKISARNELGLLATVFNQMVQQLRTSFQALEDAKATLELRVDKRTAELMAAKVAADQANQAKSEFLANMSHELRTPLNGILGYAQMLQRSPTLSPKEHDAVGIIHQCGSHLLTLINDILDLSKIEARKLELHPQETHLPSLLQGVAEICRVRADQKTVEFVYRVSDTLPAGVLVDEKRLRQVLINLLGNAVKFTTEGRVTFSAQVMEQLSIPVKAADGTAIAPLGEAHQALTRSAKIRFQIEDTGVGMSPDQLQRIFLPFEQVGSVTKQAEGTGLGLTISHQILGKMDSDLQVQSQLGVGSIFWFDLILPLSMEWVPTPQATEANHIIGYEGDRQTLLVADDKWENRAVIKSLLEPLGFTVIEAEDGQVALETAIQYPPNLFLLDLDMPRLDGIALIQQLQRSPRLQAIPIVISSASVFDADQARCLAAGAQSFLPKPVEMDELCRQLQQLLGLRWILESADAEGERSTQLPLSTPNAPSKHALQLPSREDLTQLHDLAQRGNLREIDQRSLTLAQADAALQPFADKVHHLSQGFQERELRQFFAHCLEVADK